MMLVVSHEHMMVIDPNGPMMLVALHEHMMVMDPNGHVMTPTDP